MGKKNTTAPLRLPSFATAFRRSQASETVVEKTVRQYQSGEVPWLVKLLVAWPELHTALGEDIRRMSKRERAALVAEMRGQT